MNHNPDTDTTGSAQQPDQATFRDDVRRAVETMRNGGIILYPTDTVWGIGCDATNAEAVEKIFRLKQRADSKSMLSLVDSEAMLERFATDIPDVAYQLIEAADKPLTIVYSHPTGLARNLIAPDGSAGIRITGERFSRELCRAMRRPVVSTSANISGQPAATDFDSIAEEVRRGVDYIVGYGHRLGRDASPSAIIKLGDGGLVKVIR